MSFISYLFNGLSLGSVYAIIALGYTMVYGIAKMLNFAHGDVIMIGAYISLLSMTNAGIPAFPALIISIVACTVLGIVIERIAYKPLRNASSSLAVLITAIGVSYLLQNIALLLFGANAQTFPSVIKWEGLSLAGGKLNLSGETIITILVCIVIMVLLMLFVQKTKPGQAMRAVSDQCKRNYCTHICNRFRTCRNRRCAFMLSLSKSYTLHWCNAWYQSLCRCRIRWYRFNPRCIYRRYPLRYY